MLQRRAVAFQIVQDGTKLKGKLYGDYTSTPIVDGYIAGELVTFVVSTREQSGNEINASRVRFTGRLIGFTTSHAATAKPAPTDQNLDDIFK